MDLDRPPVVPEADDDYAPDPDPVSDSDREVFREVAAHADDEGVCWPSQATVAHALGLSRETVNRRIRSLREAGWMKVTEKRWSKRNRWQHNVYDVLPGLALCPVSDLAAQRITRRAHARKVAEIVRRRRRRGLDGGVDLRLDHTKNTGRGRGKPGQCGCGSCEPDLGRFTGPNPVQLARRRWRPDGPGWREEWARRLRRAGRDPDLAYALADRLDDLPPPHSAPLSVGGVPVSA